MTHEEKTHSRCQSFSDTSDPTLAQHKVEEPGVEGCDPKRKPNQIQDEVNDESDRSNSEMGQSDHLPRVELQIHWLGWTGSEPAWTYEESSRRLYKREREQYAETDGSIED